MWKALQIEIYSKGPRNICKFNPSVTSRGGRYVQPLSKFNRGINAVSLRNNQPLRRFSTVQTDNPDPFKKHNLSINVKDIDPNVVFEEEDLLPSQKKQQLPFGKRVSQTLNTLPAKVWHELRHYYHASIQFGREIGVAVRLRTKMLSGEKITRRERGMLSKTVRDIKLLGPFIIFVIVPFMEFALPFFLKIFPNMLPSPFIDKAQKEKNMMLTTKNRLKFAKLIQDFTYFTVLDKKKRTGIDFVPFMDKIRAGKPLANAEVVEFARTFKEDFALDKLSRSQLIALCKYMEVPAWGGLTMMKLGLQRRFQDFKRDDLSIQEEGLNALNIEELSAALRDRGMNFTGDFKLILERRLAEWIDLSLIHKLPITMMAISRALAFTENEKYEYALKEALSLLPAEDATEVVMSNLDASIEYLTQKAIEMKERKAREAKEKLQAKEISENDKEAFKKGTINPAMIDFILKANEGKTLTFLEDTQGPLKDTIDSFTKEMSHEDLDHAAEKIKSLGSLSTEEFIKFLSEYQSIKRGSNIGRTTRS